MAKIQHFRFSRDRRLDTVHRTVEKFQNSGAIMRTSHRYRGRQLELAGKTLYNFESCSYMGLEMRHELREAVAAAGQQYGTQFPFSRAYLECALVDRRTPDERGPRGRLGQRPLRCVGDRRCRLSRQFRVRLATFAEKTEAIAWCGAKVADGAKG